jgi:hypothetical protein
MGANAHLPSAAGANSHLPSAMGANAHLPSSMGANQHLPSAMGNSAHLPTAMGANAHLPSTMDDGRLLPNARGPSPISFGEIDLPLVGTGGGDALGGFGGTPPPPAGGNNFGEVDLPADHGPSPGLGGGGGGGGLGFGEVDLGGGNDAPVKAPPTAISAGSLQNFQEASLDGGSNKAPTPGRLRSRERSGGPPSKALRYAAIGVAVVVVGGAALQLTPVGAFGHVWISDRMHTGDYASQATAKGDFTRKKLATDTYTVAVAAADDLADAKKKSPRNRPLGAYAAFVEYMAQIRFGNDPARAARVANFINDIPPEVAPEVIYLKAAQAAQAGQSGDWDKAKTLTEAAIGKEPKDGIQHELSILKGEVALAQKDSATALAAFNVAHTSGSSARTFFGIARAHYMAKAFGKAREAVDNTLKASPTHAGALTLRAELLWEMQHDEASAMKDLGVVLDEKNRKSIGTAELANALTTKGWIMFARDRART